MTRGHRKYRKAATHIKAMKVKLSVRCKGPHLFQRGLELAIIQVLL